NYGNDQFETRDGFASNVAPLIVHPRINPGGPNNGITANVTVTDTLASGNVLVDVVPGVGSTQQATLLMTEIPAPPRNDPPPYAYSFTAPPRAEMNASSSVTFPVTNVMPGTYVVRVRIDGADSTLADPTSPELEVRIP